MEDNLPLEPDAIAWRLVDCPPLHPWIAEKYWVAQVVLPEMAEQTHPLLAGDLERPVEESKPNDDAFLEKMDDG